MPDNKQHHDIFISYSRRDKEDVLSIKREIERTLGLKCWMDVEGIESGSSEYSQEIADAINSSTAFLFFLTASSQESEWTKNELSYAKDKKHVHVVIVRFNDDPMTDSFRLENGRRDNIDWRASDQKGKLLRDLRRWSGNGDRPQLAPSSDVQPIVVCPVCGKKNDPKDTFKCLECGKDDLCLRHQDQETFLCAECAAAQRNMREVPERKVLAGGKASERSSLTSRESLSPCSVGECTTITLPGGAEMVLVWCPPGEFVMGSPATESGRDDDETQHRVQLTTGFWLGKCPVTQCQWESVMGNRSSKFKENDLPVKTVSWYNCQEFIAKVNAALECGARLPFEAEWEYACRAGTNAPYSWGYALNGDQANCNGNYPCGTTKKGQYLENTTQVGRYGANAWGFVDMHGNVWEWCADWYGEYEGDAVDPKGPTSGTARVLRGGSWRSHAQECRAACRSRGLPEESRDRYGFRLCCSAST